MFDFCQTRRISFWASFMLLVSSVHWLSLSTISAQDKSPRPRPRIESEADDVTTDETRPPVSKPGTATPTGTRPAPSVAPKKNQPATRKKAAAQHRVSQPESLGEATPATKSTVSKPKPSAPAEAEKVGKMEPAPATVFFISDVPEVGIFLNGKKVGTTTKDKRLELALAPGHYTITTAQSGVFTNRALLISIVGDRKDVTFSYETPTTTKLPDNNAPNPNRPAPPASSSPAPPASSSPAPKAVDHKITITKYLEQKTADNFTVEDWKRVLTQSQNQLAATPEDKDAALQAALAQGQIEFLLGKYEAALVAFRVAIARSPLSPAGFLGLARTHLTMEQPAQAVSALERLVQINPTIAWAYKLLGDAHEQQKNYKQAVLAYREAAERGYDGNAITLAVQRSQAQQWMKEKQWRQAAALLQGIASRAPAAEIWLLLGQCYERQKLIYNASQFYAKAVGLDKTSALAWYKWGDALFELKDYGGAKTAFEQAIVLDPAGETMDVNRARKQAATASRKF